MPFVNTRDLLGDQAAFDALISHQLTELNENGVTTLGSYALTSYSELVSINFPSIAKVGDYSFQGCSNLEIVDFGESFVGNQAIIGANTFKNCAKLKAIILRYNGNLQIPRPQQISSMISGTPIAILEGVVYVPRSMISTYLANQQWANISKQIKAIEDYPVTDLSTINLSWTQIKAAIDDESFFSSGYAVGDIKKFYYGESYTNYAEIRKIDTVNKFVDFIVVNINEFERMESTNNMLKYSNSRIKNRLDAIYANELPSDLKSAITPVTKAYYCYDGTTEYVTASLWALNAKDSATSSISNYNSYVHESDGGEYYSDTGSRIKYATTTKTSISWFLGSAYSSTKFAAINANGTFTTVNPNAVNIGIIFGFRIQKSSS